MVVRLRLLVRCVAAVRRPVCVNVPCRRSVIRMQSHQTAEGVERSEQLYDRVIKELGPFSTQPIVWGMRRLNV